MRTSLWKLALSAALSMLGFCDYLPAASAQTGWAPAPETRRHYGWVGGNTQPVLGGEGTLPFHLYRPHEHGVDESFAGSVKVKLAIPTVEVDGAAYAVDVTHGGGAGADGSLTYYFNILNPLNALPNNWEIPLTIASKAKVTARNTDAQSTTTRAKAHLRCGYWTPAAGITWWITCNRDLVAIAYGGSTTQDSKEQTFSHTYPHAIGTVGVVKITASGLVSRASGATTSRISGTFDAYIDPFIQVDPTFMVEHNGRMIPGSEAFPIVFSEGISQDLGPPAPTFADVPAGHWAGQSIEALVDAGVTAGCSTSPPLYCPESPVTREQMAIFLLRGMGVTPPACTTAPFPDVPCSSPFAASIAELVNRGITAGCGRGNYCPNAAVTREQMAIFLLRAIGVTPPACTTPTFGDVACASVFADWIEELVARGITAGCSTSPALYCPTSAVTRAQMAVFLVETFNLPF